MIELWVAGAIIAGSFMGIGLMGGRANRYTTPCTPPGKEKKLPRIKQSSYIAPKRTKNDTHK